MTLTIPERMLLREWPNPWPKIDFGGCVLYAPLWRPDMQARGGRIVNGTGICTGSPLHLAVAANTVTVTQAGTFTVHMPEGGTVASGTMTVTGSPVTISAGIATTITTTGATGNITVTPSNIIRSKDSANQALTVTGATWTPQGRSFDGVDDRITIPSFNVTAVTVTVWVKLNESPAQYDEIIVKSSDIWELYFPTAGSLFNPSFAVNAISLKIADSSDALVQGTWAMVTGSYNSVSGVVIYINAVSKGTAAPNGNITSSAGDITVSGSATRHIGMVVGELWVYNRFLSTAEILHNYQITKWRYV